MWPVGFRYRPAGRAATTRPREWSRGAASCGERHPETNANGWRRGGAPVDCDRGPVIELDGPLGDPSLSATGYSTKPVRLSVTARIDPVSPPALSTVVNVQSPPTVPSSSADNGEIG